jgi:uncharacterized protein (DUF2141 family)
MRHHLFSIPFGRAPANCTPVNLWVIYAAAEDTPMQRGSENTVGHMWQFLNCRGRVELSYQSRRQAIAWQVYRVNRIVPRAIDAGGSDVTLKRALCAGLIIALAFFANANASQTAMITIAGTVTGGSGHHSVYVALWSEQHFLETPAQTIHLLPGADARYRFVAPIGRWGVSAFEDSNENGRLDMGLFGPKEPSGFWRAFRGHRKPRFDDIATLVDHDVVDANITLR